MGRADAARRGGDLPRPVEAYQSESETLTESPTVVNHSGRVILMSCDAGGPMGHSVWAGGEAFGTNTTGGLPPVCGAGVSGG